MADRRISILGDVTDTTGAFIALDKPGWIEALRYPFKSVVQDIVFDLNKATVWDVGLPYKFGDIVTFELNTFVVYYYCVNPHTSTGTAPYDTIANWHLIGYYTNYSMRAIELGTDLDIWKNYDLNGATAKAIAELIEANTTTGSDVLTGSDFIEFQSFEFRDLTTGSDIIYILDPMASFPYIIISAVLQSDDMIDNVAIKIEGTAIGGLENIDVTTTKTRTSATSDNSVVEDDVITLVIPYCGATPTLIRGKFEFYRT